MSEIKKIQKIGFLQEDFHSEVLDFLLELCNNINKQLNNKKITYYNNYNIIKHIVLDYKLTTKIFYDDINIYCKL